MSADNGIYILETQIPETDLREYRVAHAQAIDNLYYDVETGEHRHNFIPQVAFQYFGKCEVFFDPEEALTYANGLAEEYPILEYGVSYLFHPTQVFEYFTEEELETYEAEVEAIIERLREERDRELKAKREAAAIRLPAGTKVCPGLCHGVLFVTPEGKEIRGTVQLPEITLSEDTDFLPNDWYDKAL
jgi:hypothetical protein